MRCFLLPHHVFYIRLGFAFFIADCICTVIQSIESVSSFFHCRFEERAMPCSIKNNAVLEDTYLNGSSGLNILWKFDADFRE